jgi:hypothetical protein
MLKPERRTYRKSPGRQYEYDYDPLRSKPHTSFKSGRAEDSRTGSQQTMNRGTTSHHTSGTLAPRPDPRRTRQLLRQNILASKARATVELEPEELESEFVELHHPGHLMHGHNHGQHHTTRQQQNQEQGESKTQSRALQSYSPYPPVAAPRTRRLAELEQESEEALVDWEPQDVDPDLGYEYEEEDPLDHRLAYSPAAAVRAQPLPAPRRASKPTRSGSRSDTPDYEDDYEDEPEQKPRRRKKKGLTRRKLLWGLGLAAVGGGAVAAIELGPKLPQVVENAGTNLEKQLEDQFKKGVQAGEDAVRKEFITALEDMEGISLEAAIAAARLTRVAYDVFVSPLVSLAATVAGDFLTITLRTVQTARSWLARIYQDNDTLAALQTVLEAWVKQINTMPKQIQAITDSDLDGAQAYLRSLQHKIQQEQAKLNQSQATPTPTPKAKPASTPKKS